MGFSGIRAYGLLLKPIVSIYITHATAGITIAYPFPGRKIAVPGLIFKYAS